MQVKFETEEPSPIRREVRIEVAADDWKSHLEEVLREVTRTARIPGFRKGKVPKALIRKRFAREIENDVLERVVPHALGHALKDTGLRPIHQPVIRDVAVVDGEPFKFTAAFEVKPTIVPRDYKGVTLRPPDVSVTDEHVRGELEALREKRADFVAVEPRGLQTGDFALIDLTNDSHGEESTSEGVMIEVGGEDYHADFAKNLIGMTPGGECSFEITYGDDDPDPRARGQRVRYGVKLHDVKKRVLPEIDDDFAKDLGEYADLAALEVDIRRHLESRLGREIRRAQAQQLAEALIGQVEGEMPNALVEQELDSALQEQVRMLMMRGIDPETAPIDWRQARASLRDAAIRTVRWELLLEAIAAEEKIEPGADEVDARLEQVANETRKGVEYVRSKLEKDGRMDELKRSLRLEKVVDFLIGTAKMDGR